jgi:hypothetical protein
VVWGRLLGDDDPAAPGKDWVAAAFGSEPEGSGAGGGCTVGEESLFQYIAWCTDCESALGVEWPRDRIEHNADGSHTLIPDFVRTSPISGPPNV